MTDPPDDADDLVDLYHANLLDLLNKHKPEREQVVPDRTNSAWIDEAVIRAKLARRSAEGKTQKTGLLFTRIYTNRQENVNKAIKHAKARHFRVKLEEAASDSKKITSLLSTLLNTVSILSLTSNLKKPLNRSPIL